MKAEPEEENGAGREVLTTDFADDADGTEKAEVQGPVISECQNPKRVQGPGVEKAVPRGSRSGPQSILARRAAGLGWRA